MSNVIHMRTWAAARRVGMQAGPLPTALAHLKAARCARDRLDGPTQWREASAAADVLRERTGDGHDHAIAFARAIELQVEAQLNADRLQHARDTAERALTHIRRTAPKGTAEVMTRRVVLTVRELRGSADEVIHKFATWGVRELAKEPLERLRYLQHVLTCAKRCRSNFDVTPYVRMALKEGMELARSLENSEYRSHVACFYHVAGYTHMRFDIDRDLAVELLTSSLEGRPDTPRDLATRGMGEAERLLAAGDRDSAIEHFNLTVARLASDLPRHHRSGTEMLWVRGLIAA